jgi:hypothetical protein
MGTNEITGAKLQTKLPTKEYFEGWDRIFGKKDKQDDTQTSDSGTQGSKHEEGKDGLPGCTC